MRKSSSRFQVHGTPLALPLALSAMLCACVSNQPMDSRIAPFLGVWEPGLVPGFSNTYEPALSLTPAATAQLKTWSPAEDPILRCVPPGMPSVLSNPYPIEIEAQRKGLRVRYEEFGTIRRWSIPADAGSATRRAVASWPGPQGTSVARWEGATLVVRTTDIEPGYYNRDGLKHTAGIEIIERYRIAAEGRALDLDITVTDPVTFTAPVQFKRRWIKAPNLKLLPYQCVPDNSYNVKRQG